MPGQNTIPSVCGPLAKTPGSLKLIVQSVLSQEPWLYDPAVVELPWREELTLAGPLGSSKLTFGLCMNDGLINPQPPVKRALETFRKLVVEMGHDVIEWNPPSHQKAVEIGVC